MKKICETCKAEYEAKQRKRRYCSLSCSGKASPSLFKSGHPGFINAGTFKKGQRPVNEVPIGTVVLRDDHGAIRAWVKTADGWDFRARVVWSAANGKIERGCVVHHINENPLDDRLENLVCLTRSEHARVHQQTRTAA